MKRVYLLRHAKSSWDDRSTDDFERTLNKRGERDAPMMGKRFRQRGFVPDRIVSSTAVRAYTTARMIARELHYPLANIVRDRALYLADPGTLLATIHGTDDAVRSVMLAAHNPGLTDFANELTDRRIDNIPTCGLVVADFDVERWANLARGTGSFVCFDSPKKPPEA